MLRKKLIISVVLALLVVVSLLIISVYSDSWLRKRVIERQEVLRLKSPDGRVDAVVINADAGATTSVASLLYILPTEATVNDEKDEAIFIADHINGLNIVWSANKLLEIQYEKARIFQFCNHELPFGDKDVGYVVEIRETPLTSPPSLDERDR
ncbi:MAG: hypothetical protein ACYS1A_03995 [Planctomycetota bacterium]|jgi:hypothetical protein